MTRQDFFAAYPLEYSFNPKTLVITVLIGQEQQAKMQFSQEVADSHPEVHWLMIDSLTDRIASDLGFELDRY